MATIVPAFAPVFVRTLAERVFSPLPPPLMAYRDFTDELGIAWEAWEARPSLADRRVISDRRGVDRGTADRRVMNVPHFLEADVPLRGWLVFPEQVRASASLRYP